MKKSLTYALVLFCSCVALAVGKEVGSGCGKEIGGAIGRTISDARTRSEWTPALREQLRTSFMQSRALEFATSPEDREAITACLITKFTGAIPGGPREAKAIGDAAVRKISERATDRNIIRLGVSVSCPRCQQENWYDLARVDYTIRCDRCLREYSFPQGDLTYTDRDWRFRVVGPFTLPNFALGAYSTALTLRVLSIGLKIGHSRMTWCTGLDLTRGDRVREVDLVAWYEPERMSWDDSDPTLVLGESKSFGTEVFHKKDIDRLRDVAEWFPGCCLVLSTMKRNLSPDERKRMSTLAEWGRVPTHDGTPRAWVVVLTGSELFYTWSVGHAWEELGGKHAQLAQHNAIHFGDMPTLADFTQQVYLGLPSLDSERVRRRKPKRSTQ